MGKLHELLPVSNNLQGQAAKCAADLKNTFQKKQHHFTERRVTFKSLIESEPDVVEDQLDLQTTVKGELEWVSNKLAKAIDAAHQIDVANTAAKADVVLEDGTVLLSDVPATSLLQLERRVGEIKSLVDSIPTLDPAKGFSEDRARGAGVYKARELERPRTKKVFEVLTLAQPTDKHPAQVEKITVDKPVGMLLTQEWSSLVTVSEKADMLDRVESLLRAVKQARARANEIVVDQSDATRVGQTLLRYVFGN